MIPLKGVLHWTRHKLKALAGSEVLPCNGHCPSYGTPAQSLSNQSGKNQRLSSIFDSCWRNEVSNFRLQKFEKVGPFCEPNEPDVDINTRNSLDNSGSNETMQKVLALIV